MILSSFDPMFPGNLTETQNAYMQDPSSGWTRVGTSETYNPDDYQPGDIFLTRGAGHTFMWIGNYHGKNDIIAQASWAPKKSKHLLLPALMRYAVNEDTGLDGLGRAYDVWRFTGRNGTPDAPIVDSSSDYRNIFTGFEVTTLNAARPETMPYRLTPDTSSLAVKFKFNVPNDAKGGDDFVLESVAPFDFVDFDQFKIENAEGDNLATMKRLSKDAVRLVLDNAVESRSDITGAVLLTVEPSRTMVADQLNQRLTFYGGEQELGPNRMYDIAAWRSAKTGFSAAAQIYNNQPGLESRVVYRFKDVHDVSPEDVQATITLDTSAARTLCDQSSLHTFDWLSDKKRPISSGAASIVECSETSVTVAPPSALPPPGATGIQFNTPWITEESASLQKFTAKLSAPNAGKNGNTQWVGSYRSAALHGTADSIVLPHPSEDTVVSDSRASNTPPPWGNPLRMVYLGVLLLVLVTLVFFIGFRLGRRRK